MNKDSKRIVVVGKIIKKDGKKVNSELKANFFIPGCTV